MAQSAIQQALQPFIQGGQTIGSGIGNALNYLYNGSPQYQAKQAALQQAKLHPPVNLQTGGLQVLPTPNPNGHITMQSNWVVGNPIQQAAQQAQQGIQKLIQPMNQQQQNVLATQTQAGDYQNQAAKIFKQENIPPAIGLGIWAMEGRGKTINPNNPYNIGAYDSNPENAKAYKFSTPLDGTEEAAKFLKGQSQYQRPNVKKVFQNAYNQLQKDGDSVKYLKTIAPTYSSNPNYVNTIIQTPEFQNWSSH